MRPDSPGLTSSCTRRCTRNQASPALCAPPPYGASSRASGPVTSARNASADNQNSSITNTLHINEHYDIFFLINGDLPMSKQFASHADLEDKVVSFEKLSDNAYAYTAEGDPNTGIIVGDESVMVIDTQATPVMAQDVIRRVREVTDKPIKYILLSHYHAVRVFGASAYGAQEILASRDTYDLIAERGEQDKASEIGRFPRLFRNVE